MHAIDVDALYRTFCDGLPAALRDTARRLAFRLELAPTVDVPWSAVFKHDVTLTAPALFADALPNVSSTMLSQAVLAHLLAVVEAFGTDRIADGQVPDAPDLRGVLECFRRGRDHALAEVGARVAAAMGDEADRQTLQAIERERHLFAENMPVDFDLYETVSAGKQTVGFPATIALARSANLDERQLFAVRETLMGIWLGLQFQDDVVDWEDDMQRGGAWAVLLARHHGFPKHGIDDPLELRRAVLASGALAEMLEGAAHRYGTAREHAKGLGAGRLAQWLEGREAEVTLLLEGERENPGYVLRLRKLSPWAAEVLA